MTSPQSLASAIPDAESLTNAANLQILDSKGKSITFGSLFENKKTIVVFIRHFFCGNCQMFVEQLASLPQDIFHEADARIVVIGCGNWQAIQAYADTTNFYGPIFADPDRSLYRALGMNIEKLAGTPSDQQRKSYITRSPLKNALQSILKGPLKHPGLIGKQGNISQLGGEFVLGPGLTCSFAWRMQNTEDHAEIAELLSRAGVRSTPRVE